MQLDIDVSPTSNIMTFWLTLTHVTFHLDQHDFWPWPIWPLTPNITCKAVKWDLKIAFFDLVTLTVDLWPWPSRSSLGSPTCMFWSNFMPLTATVFEIWIIVKWISVQSQTDGQTDRRKAMHKSPQCISTDGLKKKFIAKGGLWPVSYFLEGVFKGRGRSKNGYGFPFFFW